MLRKAGAWLWKTSEVVDFEIGQTPNLERRTQVRLLTRFAGEKILLDDSIIQRADTLKQQHGFKAYDALHLACAEAGEVSVFLTTDDRLLKRAQKNRQVLNIDVRNPLDWLQEHIS